MAHCGSANRQRGNVSAQKDDSGSFIAVDDALVRKTTTVVAAWTQHGRAACSAYGGARLAERRGRCDAARAHVACGDPGEGRDGGSQGWPTTHGPAGQGRPRRAGPVGPRRGSVRDAGVARVGAAGSVSISLGPVCVSLSPNF
jgi:hypothetical protein